MENHGTRVDSGAPAVGLRSQKTGLRSRPAGTPSDVGSDARTRRRIAFAGMVGTLIEFYDFQIYGVAAALVFSHVFFPSLGTAAAAAASIATFGVAFVARPVGSLVFGHFGDRLGRKKMLVVALLGMGIATVGVGLTPTAAQIGVAAPLILVVLRFIQGVSAGGELAGAQLYCAEVAPAETRGFWASVPNLGSNFAITIVNATFLVMALWVSPQVFQSWGWRVPFLASSVLLAVGLYVRLRIEESPVFEAQSSRDGVARVPVFEAFRRQGRDIVLGLGVGVTAYAIAYLWLVFLVGYAVTTLHLSQIMVLVVGMIAGLVCTLAVVVSGIVSDRIGRRRALLWINVIAAVWALLMFPVIDLATVASYAIATFISAFVGTFELGVLAAYLPELFQTRYRFTASGISMNGASLLGGAVIPLLAPVIISAFGGFAMGVVLFVICVVAALCARALRETRGGTLEWTDVPPALPGESPSPTTV